MNSTAIPILMIDDDEDDARLVEHLLDKARDECYWVDWARSPELGLEQLCANHHDLCLLDYNLGSRNGLELLGEARRRGSQVPVILLTGMVTEELDQAALQAGALDYLSKNDLSGDHLERSLRYSLQRARELRALDEARQALTRKVEERTAELAASEEFNRRIVESSLDCMIVLDLEGRLLSINSGGLKLLQIEDPAPLLGQSWMNFWLKRDEEQAGQAMAQARQGGTGRFQASAPTASGQAQWWDILITPIPDWQGRPERLLLIARDMTEQKQAEASLRQANERLAEANDCLAQANEQLAEADRRKDEFLAMLAHELRNPLAPIRNAVEIMQMSGPLNPSLARQRDVIDRQVSHMARLLNDLLDVSRITRGKIVLHKRPLDLAMTLAQAIESVNPLIETRRQQLSVILPAGPLRVEADPDRLMQIAVNLLSNASKYTEEGGRILLEATKEERQAVIHVRDTGVGIAPEMLPKIFDLFIQADRTLDRAQGGLGIGLTMVRRLVEMHNGRVEAASAGLGQGSTFTVYLPLLAEENPDVGVPSPAMAAGEGEPATPARRILIVDDLVDTAESLAELLRLWRHDVRTAHDGPEALEIARQFRPEVVLLDIGLPFMDGFEVARRLRREHADESMVIAAVTGYAQEEDRKMAQEAGFDLHFSKPVPPEALIDLLGRIPA